MTGVPRPGLELVGDLVAALDLAPAGADAFSGANPDTGRVRIFGGLVVAQALIAMGRTARERPVHSLHGYFLLPGDPAAPIAYAVERTRDGRSFSTRRCVASQRDRAIFAVGASFHEPEADGFDHGAPMPAVPMPEELPTRDEIRAGSGPELPEALRRYLGRPSPVELRGCQSFGVALRNQRCRGLSGDCRPDGMAGRFRMGGVMRGEAQPHPFGISTGSVVPGPWDQAVA